MTSIKKAIRQTVFKIEQNIWRCVRSSLTISLHNNIDEPPEFHSLIQVYQKKKSNWLHYCVYLSLLSHFSSMRKATCWSYYCFLTAFPPLCISIVLTRKKLPQLVIITTFQICICYSLWVLIDSDTHHFVLLKSSLNIKCTVSFGI